VPDIDFFNFFRYLLGTIVTIYATIVTLQSLWGWYVFLTGSDKYIGLVRRYVIVHGLRLRFKSFWGDVIICILLCVVFVLLWHAHGLIYQMGDTIRSVREVRDLRAMPAKVSHVPSHA
jgi:hypothetical protein